MIHRYGDVPPQVHIGTKLPSWIGVVSGALRLHAIAPSFKLNATFTALPRHQKAVSIRTRIDFITEPCLLNPLLITCRSCVQESQG